VGAWTWSAVVSAFFSRRRIATDTTSNREHRRGSPIRADMADLGRTGTWEAHSEARTPAPHDVARRLGIEPGDPCVRTSYEFLADARPAQLSVSWEPRAITGDTPVLLPEMGPLAGKGVVDIVTALEVPRPGRATQAQANLLGIGRGYLVLVIERTYYDGDGRAVETADITVPDARWEVAYEFAVDAR
jgi:GntR family transcriptional regulator